MVNKKKFLRTLQLPSLGRGHGALTSTSPAPESSASQETTWHSEGLHVQLLLLGPGCSPTADAKMFSAIFNLQKVKVENLPSPGFQV